MQEIRISDNRGREGEPISDFLWQGRVGVGPFLILLTRGVGGLWIAPFFPDTICEQPLDRNYVLVRNKQYINEKVLFITCPWKIMALGKCLALFLSQSNLLKRQRHFTVLFGNNGFVFMLSLTKVVFFHIFFGIEYLVVWDPHT